MPPPATPAINVRDRVLNTFSGSSYHGQIGIVETVRPGRDSGEAKYHVRWSDGQVMSYRRSSLAPAGQPEHTFKLSDSGFRSSEGIKKRRVVHKVPASSRSPLI